VHSSPAINPNQSNSPIEEPLIRPEDTDSFELHTALLTNEGVVMSASGTLAGTA